MPKNRINPRDQFSKRLARWTAVFWFLYMTWLSIIFIYEPSTALYCVYMAIIGTAVMLTSVIAYTHNSVTEKIALTLLDKTKIELSLKNDKSKSDDSSETPEEEGDNG